MDRDEDGGGLEGMGDVGIEVAKERAENGGEVSKSTKE